MHSNHPKAWSFRQQLNAIIFIALFFVMGCGVFGGWRLLQFSSSQVTIQQSSQALHQNLYTNFDKTRLIGEIHTQLRLYMQSGKADNLDLIHKYSEDLRRKLSTEEQKTLGHFLEMIDTLEIRMKSLEENTKKIAQTEKALIDITGQLINISSREEGAIIRPLVVDSCLQHHQLYVTAIVANQIDALTRIQIDAAGIFTTLDAKLTTLGKTLSSDQQGFIERLKTTNYELDETVHTITSIRITTLETQQRTEQFLETLNAGVTEDSLTKNTEASALMDTSLQLARSNLLFVSASLIGSAFLFAIIAFFLNQRMIRPLIGFVELLRRMTQLLAGLRGQQVAEDENLIQLSEMAISRHDELGEAALAVKMLITRLRELSLFRQTIEADESTEEIYARLAQIFEYKLGLELFVILEQSDENSTAMAPVYCNPPELAPELPEFAIAEHCRAKRTGLMITSLETPFICKQYPFSDTMDHICIPMLVGGHVIGVVQFLFSLDLPEAVQHIKNKAVEEARYYIAEALPILQAKHLAQKLKDMATKDPLTGLYNRRYLDSVIEQFTEGTIRRKSKIGVLMCDIDHFKRVNDLFGHDTGDSVLIQLAQICMSCARKSDLVIRFGGEEFLLLLPDCDESCAATMAERIRATIESHKVHTPNRTLQQTISIGVAEFSHDSTKTIWEIIKLADIALYQAKENGRNQVLICQDDSVNKELANIP
ncbi:MAG: diguanylate cyclase [Proteobacteria bacterium]|jgi:diguanylate cyclase (GGDEF)-like protein|nr:diguanylate cyclase [Pseudomonadota bacterium]MBU4328168.1 diguanylate cyclase [Pseudomonadota bacterium]